MNELFQYIKSSFNIKVDADAKQHSINSKLALLNKDTYNIFVTPIHINNLSTKQEEYISIVKKAVDMWSNVLFETNIKFNVVDTLYKADIKVYWTKENVNYNGMQYVEENLNHKNLCVTLGIVDIDSNTFSNNEVLHLALHEFGHILGLGHSNDPDDVMCPNGNWAFQLTQNDIIVLNLIYAIGSKKNYCESESFINNYLKNWGNTSTTEYKKDLIDILDNIGLVKKYNLLQQEINVEYKGI